MLRRSANLDLVFFVACHLKKDAIAVLGRCLNGLGRSGRTPDTTPLRTPQRSLNPLQGARAIAFASLIAM